ncbi:valine--tRNA ligase, mitochondrial-like isoform X1 [Dermacentor silvarum]|uniref:valine--tRNA ligase, mitochondrial-like isoform X1 n=2 Tax=Dermacentor silvarum TaxID=543639 RepID=UPI001897B43B|nr:valine--tRNA ligase, mitochondrial-like isoform X1 [Dermacentor silvarum]
MWSYPRAAFCVLCACQKRFPVKLVQRLSATVSSSALPKDVSGEFPKVYNSEDVEAGWFDWWEASGNHGPCKEAKEEGTFSMVLPPPNITGDLHLGHALTVTIQDTLVRWHRMCGKRVVWVPGCDHAGIATQMVVEKKIWADQGITRQQLGRQPFLEAAHTWKKQKEANILRQLKRLGASLDYSRFLFTMDEPMSEAVTTAFVRLFDAGLIYREKKMVNWCYWLQSAISDSEVKHVAISPGEILKVPGSDTGVEVGFLERVALPIDNTEIEVATTRLETMLADTAVAVHPEDPRHAHFIGRRARHPITGRELPVVADSLVDRSFGTGAMKVTPGYSKVDYALSKKHSLPILECFDDEGRVIEGYEAFSGLSRFEVRDAIRERLQQIGAHRSRLPHATAVPVCSRSGDLLDFRLKPQFFLRFERLAQEALQAVESGELVFEPDHCRKAWVEWLTRTEDWCISRQLWWGHQIPAYRVLNADSEDVWVSAATAQEAAAKAAVKLGVEREDVLHLRQDEDVLDTWFSSALFPFSVFGWPHNTRSLRNFYPLSLMETGQDILFFWVARMVMLGKELTGQLPFTKVLLHGMIRDAEGRKMSKSLGNVLDPLDIIHGKSLQDMEATTNELHRQGYIGEEELRTALKSQRQAFPNGITKCGSDALRLALLLYDVTATNVNFQMKDAVYWLHFCNKFWQATRFFLSAAEKLGNSPQFIPLSEIESQLSLTDRWLLSCLSRFVGTCNDSLSTGTLHHFAAAIQTFVVQQLCDVYLESMKAAVWESRTAELERTCSVLWVALSTTLRLMAPAAPFLCEEVHQRLSARFDKGGPFPSICTAPYPTSEQWCSWRAEDLERRMQRALSIVSSLRSARLTCGLKQPRALVKMEDENADFVRQLAPTVCHLAKLQELTVLSSTTLSWEPPSEAHWTQAMVDSNADIYIETDRAAVQAAVQQRLKQLLYRLNSLEQRQSHPRYRFQNSTAEQARHTEQIADMKKEIKRLQEP